LAAERYRTSIQLRILENGYGFYACNSGGSIAERRNGSSPDINISPDIVCNEREMSYGITFNANISTSGRALALTPATFPFLSS
jgi:hypothetical protein